MEPDPTKDEQPASGDPAKEKAGSTQGPGNVTVDEPTDPALSGTSDEDFGDEEGSAKEN